MAKRYQFLTQASRAVIGSISCYGLATFMSNSFENEQSYKVNIARYILLKSQNPHRIQVEQLEST